MGLGGGGGGGEIVEGVNVYARDMADAACFWGNDIVGSKQRKAGGITSLWIV